jgi:hypothetical protein
MNGKQHLCVRVAIATLLGAVEDRNADRAQDWEGITETIFDLIDAFPQELGVFQTKAERICGDYLVNT